MSTPVGSEGTSSVVLDDLQREIQLVSRQFLAGNASLETTRRGIDEDTGVAPTVTGELVKLGWMGLTVGEEHGGSGLGLVERCLVLEEMGAVLYPAPYLSVGFAADILAFVAPDGSTGEDLVQLADGRRSYAGADLRLGDASLEVDTDGSGHRLTGTISLVLDADMADELLVTANVGGEAAVLSVRMDAQGVARTAAPTLDLTRSFADVRLSAAPARRLDAGGTEAGLARVRERAEIGLSAELVGGAQESLDRLVAFVKDRRQFGVPIGSFQAIKHRLAEAFVKIEAAREATYLAADVHVSGLGPAGAVAAAAKLSASAAFELVTEEGIQLLGGIGFTWEHDAHLFYRRAIVGSRLLGSPADHRRRLVELLEL